MEQEPISLFERKVDKYIETIIQSRFPTLRSKESIYSLVLIEITKNYVKGKPLSKYDVKKALKNKYSPTSVERAFKALLEKKYIEVYGERKRRKGEGKVKVYRPTQLGLIAASIIDSPIYLLHIKYYIPNNEIDVRVSDSMGNLLTKILKCKKCLISRKIIQEAIPVSIPCSESEPLLAEYAMASSIESCVGSLIQALLIALKLDLEERGLSNHIKYAALFGLLNIIIGRGATPRIPPLPLMKRFLEEAKEYESEIMDYLEKFIEREKVIVEHAEKSYRVFKEQGLFH